KAIAAGLPAEAALRALTIDAAQILGVEKQLGTITPGKAAHLVVMDGRFDEAATQVRYVFADGVRFEYEPAPKGKEPRKEPMAKEGPAKDKAAEVATEIDADRKPRQHTGGNVLLRGATVLPVTGPALPETDILVQKGKIAAIGKGLKAPEGVTVIEAR